jgi:hypothetical protein
MRTEAGLKGVRKGRTFAAVVNELCARMSVKTLG